MLRRRKQLEAQCEAFLDQNRGLLYRVAGSYEADPAVREDLLQEIVMAIWSAAKRFRSESGFKTFALRIAHNRAISHCARQAQRPQLVHIDELDLQGPDNPESAAFRSRRLETVLSAVRSLPLAQRQVVSLALDGSSYQEIAEICGISVSNVGVRLNRAKARLREIINV